MTRYKVGSIIWGIFFGIFVIADIPTFITTAQAEAVVSLSIITGITLIGMVINIIQFYKTRAPEGRERMKQEKNKQKQEKIRASIYGDLVSGLNLAEKTKILVNLLMNKIVFKTNNGSFSANQTFELELEKVTNVTILSDQQVQQIVSQSAPGMIIGAAAFGLLGAMVGGRVKTKNKKITKYFFVVDYTSNNENNQVIINIEKRKMEADNFIYILNKFKPLQNTTTQL